jgi:hypothetical protein
MVTSSMGPTVEISVLSALAVGRRRTFTVVLVPITIVPLPVVRSVRRVCCCQSCCQVVDGGGLSIAAFTQVGHLHVAVDESFTCGNKVSFDSLCLRVGPPGEPQSVAYLCRT